MPPKIDAACGATAAYEALYPRVKTQNTKLYQRFPRLAPRVRRVVRFLESQPHGYVVTPRGNHLTPRLLQSLGLSGLGSQGGHERLYYLFEDAFVGVKGYAVDDDDDDDKDVGGGVSSSLSPGFLKEVDNWISFDTNPLYFLLHEPCYCQGGEAPNWAAQRLRETSAFARDFDASLAVAEKRNVLFTGEMVYPWIADDIAGLRAYKQGTVHIDGRVNGSL